MEGKNESEQVLSLSILTTDSQGTKRPVMIPVGGTASVQLDGELINNKLHIRKFQLHTDFPLGKPLEYIAELL